MKKPRKTHPLLSTYMAPKDLKEAKRIIGQLYEAIDAMIPQIPFSLSCSECDCDDGLDVNNTKAASDAGWLDVQCDPTGLGYNFIGLCPGCAKGESAAAKYAEKFLKLVEGVLKCK